MISYQSAGRQDIRREFCQAHVERLKGWFSPDGVFVDQGCDPSTRERLWNCFSLYEAGDAQSKSLANALVLATPTDRNHFTPIIAADLLLTFAESLDEPVRAHLLAIMQAQFINLMEVRFGSDELHNFTCMTTYFLLAAGQLLNDYEFNHPLASIPEVYSKERIQSMGRNALYALAHKSRDGAVCSEFNSPTYLPISIICMAKIVEHIDDEKAKEIALSIEGRLWWEALSLYHPGLGLSCGPYSRAYRIDVLGMCSQMRMLLCYAGISRDRSVVTLLDDTLPGSYFHHDGDMPFNWSGPAWKHAQPLHIPSDLLESVKRWPGHARFSSRISWGSFGAISADGKLLSVQGSILPAGEGEIHQIQEERYALGYRSLTTRGHSFPISLHYGLTMPVQSMCDVRNVLAGVFFQDKPEEWTTDQKGEPIEASNFNHSGYVEVKDGGEGSLSFTGMPLTCLAPVATEEISVNAFIPVHFSEVSAVTLNGEAWSGDSVEQSLQEVEVQVEDHGFQFALSYRFDRPVRVRLWRWANFIRFSGFYYEGEAKTFSPDELQGMTVSGRVEVKAESTYTAQVLETVGSEA